MNTIGDDGDNVPGGFSSSFSVTFDGMGGTDLLQLKPPGGLTTVRIEPGTIEGGHYDGSTVTGIEKVEHESDSTSIKIIGDGADNVLIGGNEAGTVDGGAGSDTIEGGAGDDILTGGADADEFVGARTFGHDAVTDWDDGVDLMVFERVAGVRSFGDLDISDDGTGTLIVAGNHAVTLEGFTGTVDPWDVVSIN